MSFPPANEMFQFAGFAPLTYVFSQQSPKRAGFPHSEIRGSKGARPSPRLFAACHVLHRLSVPRHPPNALKRLIRSPSIAHREQSLHPRPQKPRLNTQHFILVLPAWPMTIRFLVQRPISRSSAQHKPTTANGQSHSYPQCKTSKPEDRDQASGIRRPRPNRVQFLSSSHGSSDT